MEQFLLIVLAYFVTLVYATVNNEDNSPKTAFVQGFILFVGLVLSLTILAWLVNFITPRTII